MFLLCRVYQGHSVGFQGYITRLDNEQLVFCPALLLQLVLPVSAPLDASWNWEG